MGVVSDGLSDVDDRCHDHSRTWKLPSSRAFVISRQREIVHVAAHPVPEMASNDGIGKRVLPTGHASGSPIVSLGT